MFDETYKVLVFFIKNAYTLRYSLNTPLQVLIVLYQMRKAYLFLKKSRLARRIVRGVLEGLFGRSTGQVVLKFIDMAEREDYSIQIVEKEDAEEDMVVIETNIVLHAKT